MTVKDERWPSRFRTVIIVFPSKAEAEQFDQLAATTSDARALAWALAADAGLQLTR